MGMFTEATRKRKKLRMLLAGPTNAGKTRTALRFAFGIVAHELKLKGENRPPKISVIDTEHGRASFHYGQSDDGISYIFKTCELTTFNPNTAVAAMKECWAAGLDALIIDSESHFWEGEDGVLAQHNKFTKARKDNNSYAAWQDATALQNLFIESQLKSPFHIIGTVRQKMDAVQDRDAAGKTVIRSIGLQDQQRDTFRYEFDVIGNITQDHELTIVKKPPFDGLSCEPIKMPGAAFITPLIDWLNEADGAMEVHSFPALSPDAAESAAAAIASVEKERLAASVRAAAAVSEAEKARQATDTKVAAETAAGTVSQTTATATQSPASPAQSQTASTTGQSSNSASIGFASLEAVTEIKIILNTLQLPGQPQQIYTSRNITDLAQLKPEDAAGILTKLRPKMEEHRAKQAASGNTVVSPASAVAPAAPGNPDDPKTINPDDQKKILAGLAKLKIGDDDLKRILAKMTMADGKPLQCLQDMSYNQGKNLLTQMIARITRDFGSCPF